MSIEIKKLEKADYKKAIQAAIIGMHFNVYLQNEHLLQQYGKYFWYSELLNCTQIIAAYSNGQFAGVLLADMKNEKKVYHSFAKTVYVKLFDILQAIYSKKSTGRYEQVNSDMLMEYKKNNRVDGEIRFLAADPECKEKGIGTALLRELEKREAGKRIYLFTDEQCTYQFYEHRGFERVGERDVSFELEHRNVPLKCFMYSKQL